MGLFPQSQIRGPPLPDPPPCQILGSSGFFVLDNRTQICPKQGIKSLLSEARVGVGSKELLEWDPKSYWSGLQRAIGVGSKL